jgi:hypothetical protein
MKINSADGHKRDLPGVPQQREEVLMVWGGRGMKIEDIKNVAVFFNMNGKTGSVTNGC